MTDFDCLGLSQRAYRAVDLYSQQLMLACRQAEPPRVVDRPMCIREDDDGVLAVQQVVDLLMDALYVRAESLSEVSQFSLRRHALRSQRRTDDRPTARIESNSLSFTKRRQIVLSTLGSSGRRRDGIGLREHLRARSEKR